MKENILDYDTWFDYIRLLESEEDLEKIRDAYEKAIAQIPPIAVSLHEKSFIFRVFCWLFFLLNFYSFIQCVKDLR